MPLTPQERLWCQMMPEALDLESCLMAAMPKLPLSENSDWIQPYLEKEIINSFVTKFESSCVAYWSLGIGCGTWLKHVLKWLDDEDERFFVVFEPDLGVLRAFLQSEIARVCCHPRLAIFSIDPSQEVKTQKTLQLGAQLLCDTRSCGLQYPGYKTPEYEEMFINILRMIEDLQALRRHQLLAPDLVSHALYNFSEVVRGHIHADLEPWIDSPVVLCGAGPSINRELKLFHELQDRWIRISCGTASQILQKAYIMPDWMAAVCPYFTHFDRSRKLDFFEIPVITGIRVHPGVMRLFGEVKVTLKGRPRCGIESFISDETEVDYGISVLTSALKACVDMGARKIVLVGVDLCYTNSQKYGAGADVVCSGSTPMGGVWLKDSQGRPVLSTQIWREERDWIEEFLRQHPSVEVVQTSATGLEIEGAACERLEETIKRWSVPQRDIMAFEWQAYHQITSTTKQLDPCCILDETLESIIRVQEMIAKRLQEIRFVAADPTFMEYEKILQKYECELSSEPTFKWLLAWLDGSIQAMQQRSFWKIKNDVKFYQESMQVLGFLTLFTTRLSIMLQRLNQLRDTLECVF